jgi:trehalose 6-phosphate synthase
MARIVIVSNRVPVPTERGPRAGGLTVVLREALQPGSLWFGWSGRIGTTSTQAQCVTVGGITYATVDLSQVDHRHYYVGYANGVLWPLLHFRLGLVTFRREDLEGYTAVNHAFAKALAPLLRQDDLIWVHDFHLIPLAHELRALGFKNRIGFFLHVPFVPASVFAALPQADTLLRALCAYDVVGFQTEEHLRQFFDCTQQLLGLAPDGENCIRPNGHVVHAIVAPAGIDARSFAGEAMRAARREEGRRMTESLAGRALIVGADRLDYSKGLSNRFEAYARLLKRWPEHRRAVTYLQVAARSREEVGDYRDLRRELDRAAGNINGRFAEPDWAPLRYMTRTVARATLAGFYRLARVGLVTPLRDGMNLVAKEFVAAQDPADPGVLVLSRFAGAAEELAAALVVNPNDPDEIAEALHAGLTMGHDERRERFERLSARVFSSTADAYCRRFLEALRGAAQPGGNGWQGALTDQRFDDAA